MAMLGCDWVWEAVSGLCMCRTVPTAAEAAVHTAFVAARELLEGKAKVSVRAVVRVYSGR